VFVLSPGVSQPTYITGSAACVEEESVSIIPDFQLSNFLAQLSVVLGLEALEKRSFPVLEYSNTGK